MKKYKIEEFWDNKCVAIVQYDKLIHAKIMKNIMYKCCPPDIEILVRITDNKTGEIISIKNKNRMKIKLQLFFAWYDMYVGVYINIQKRWMYIVFFMIGIIIKFPFNETSRTHSHNR